MNPNSALVKKDILVSKKKLMIPVWITLAVYAFVLIALIFSFFIRTETEHDLNDLLNESMGHDVQSYTLFANYMFNFVLALLTGFLLLISITALCADSLNPDARNSYELFHRCQPVSILKLCLSRLIAIALGSWVVYIAISLTNYIVFNLLVFTQLKEVLSWSFPASLSGLFHAALPTLLVSFILTAAGMFFSALFKESSQVKAAGVVFILSILPTIINRLYGWRIPGLYRYFVDVIQIATKVLDKSELSPSSFSIPSMMNIFDLNTLLHIIVGVIIFLGATYMYSTRQIMR